MHIWPEQFVLATLRFQCSGNCRFIIMKATDINNANGSISLPSWSKLTSTVRNMTEENVKLWKSQDIAIDHGTLTAGQVLYIPVGGIVAITSPENPQPCTCFKTGLLPKSGLEKALGEVAAIKDFFPTVSDANTLGLIQDAAAQLPKPT